MSGEKNLTKLIEQQLFNLGTEGIKLRQLQYDIDHMKSDAGWAVAFEET